MLEKYSLSKEEMAKVLATYMEKYAAKYEDNMITLGYVELDKPSRINIYPKDFESKEKNKGTTSVADMNKVISDIDDNLWHSIMLLKYFVLIMFHK